MHVRIQPSLLSERAITLACAKIPRRLQLRRRRALCVGCCVSFPQRENALITSQSPSHCASCAAAAAACFSDERAQCRDMRAYTVSLKKCKVVRTQTPRQKALTAAVRRPAGAASVAARLSAALTLASKPSRDRQRPPGSREAGTWATWTPATLTAQQPARHNSCGQ